ncbi:MAG: hypothetical protein AB9873_11410 [Syntrophobacteraceae bacterium]
MGWRDGAIAVIQKLSAGECSSPPGSGCQIGAVPAIPAASRLGCKHRREILAAYVEVLKVHSSSMKPASSLPYPKDLIRQAIVEELIETLEAEDLTHLEFSYSQLEVFLESREYNLVEKFARIKSVVDRLARSGMPLDLLAAGEMARKFPGDKVVGIFQRVSKQISIRLAEVRRLSRQGTA